MHLVLERLYDSLERDSAAWQLQRVTRATAADDARDLGSTRENWTGALTQLLAPWFDHSAAELRHASNLVVTLARGFVYDFLDTPVRQRRDRREQVDAMSSFVVGGLTTLLSPPLATPRR